MIEFKKAQKEQVEELTQISKAAFDTDIEVGADEVGGPPDYDSVKWHDKMQKQGNLYAFSNNGKLVGGAILFQDRKDKHVVYVGRIFIAPQYHRQGLGIEMMKHIQQNFLGVQVLRLETPVWNVRTNAFYKKCGFQQMFRNQESVYFEKTWGDK